MPSSSGAITRYHKEDLKMSAQHASVAHPEPALNDPRVQKPEGSDNVSRQLRIKRAMDTSRSALQFFIGPLQRHFGV
jgi:hypothetical protein